MTAISIWYNDEIKENLSLWIAADSRVTTSSSSVLIDDASKIFGLPIICRSSDKSGFFSKVTYNHTYGYCFAGSTLLGQNTYLSLLTLLSNLITVSPHDIPNMAEVSQFILNFFRLAFDEYKTRVGQAPMFEATLFGWCHFTEQLFIFHYFPELKNGVYQVSCVQYENMSQGDFIYLGDKKDYMSKKIADGFISESVPGRSISRIPRHIIEDHIDDDDFPTIGGDIQLGIADKYGYHPYVLCKPRIKGKPEAYFSYLGHELTDDIRFVGKAVVGGPAIV